MDNVCWEPWKGLILIIGTDFGEHPVHPRIADKIQRRARWRRNGQIDMRYRFSRVLARYERAVASKMKRDWLRYA